MENSEEKLSFLRKRLTDLLEIKKNLETKVRTFDVKCDLRTIELNIKTTLEIIEKVKINGDFTMR
jgi:hypothetical protein